MLFDIAGFTNLTQDHLDLHGTMEDYFATKAELFTPGRALKAVVTVDDEWGRRLAATARIPVITLSMTPGGAPTDWTVTSTSARGLGTDFSLQGADGATLNVHTGLPGAFNVANAALAAVMVLASGMDVTTVQAALDHHDPSPWRYRDACSSSPKNRRPSWTSPTTLMHSHAHLKRSGHHCQAPG
ncbi:UDP-N-acetylmuramyl-tripeptide synthetase [Arthrobacter sp. Hiyo4]|nr:UDP-N-acetylmuramyl-tripeptide synthetase [Arthrobacter sp. Hiyo4]